MQTLGGSLGAAEAEKLIPTLVGQFRHLSLAAGPEHFQLARTLLSQIETSMDIVRWYRCRQRLPKLCLAHNFLVQSGEQLGTLHLAHLEAPHLVLLDEVIRFDRVSSLGGFILRQK